MRWMLWCGLMVACGGDGDKDVSTETTDTAATATTTTTQTTGPTGTATTSTTPLTRCEPLPVSGTPSITLTPADGVEAIQAALDAASPGDVGMRTGAGDVGHCANEGVARGVSGNPEAVILTPTSEAPSVFSCRHRTPRSGV